jgi:hypothetical protein
MKRLLTQFVASLAAAAALAAPAYADPSWTYTTNASPLAVAPDVPGGGLVLTSQSTPSAVTTGGSGIVATTVLGTISLGTDHYTNAGYEVDIGINDQGSGQSHTFAFHGQFSGDFSATTGSNITHQFLDPVTNQPVADKVSESFTIGGNLYTVTLDPHVIIGALGSFPASIGGFVDVNGSGGGTGSGGDGGGGGIQTTPEPSTMVLSALGMSMLGLAALRRRLRRQMA